MHTTAPGHGTPRHWHGTGTGSTVDLQCRLPASSVPPVAPCLARHRRMTVHFDRRTDRRHSPWPLFGVMTLTLLLAASLALAMFPTGANAQALQNTSASCPQRALKPFCKTVIDYSIDESAVCTYPRDALVRKFNPLCCRLSLHYSCTTAVALAIMKLLPITAVLCCAADSQLSEHYHSGPRQGHCRL